ncbi:MAG: helix-turn-helix transcriptional regulator [Myxococcota bacterium]
MKRSVGRVIAEARIRLGLTQQELAERIGDVSAQYCGHVEQGRQNLTIETLVKFARGLGLHPRELFEEPESMEPLPRGRPRTR